MHALVSLVLIIISSVIGQAKMPPPLAPQVESLKSALVRYQGQTAQFTILNKQLGDLVINRCDFKKDHAAIRITECVVDLDRLGLQIGSLTRAIPFIREGLGSIPTAFTPIKSLLEGDLAVKEQWLKGASEKLRDKADELFEASKKAISDSVDKQINESESKARFEAICSSSRSHLNLHQKFANYFDSIHASYAQYERLRFQLVQTLWKIELLEGKCPLIKSQDVVQGNKLFSDLATKVDAKAFSKFKASNCSFKNLKAISKEECLRLPQTPEAVSVLESIQEKAGGHK